MNLNRDLRNAVWIATDHLVKSLSSIIVLLFVARVLGPTSFGQLGYVLAIGSVCLAVGRLGLDSIVIKELGAGTDKMATLSAATLLMLLAALCLTSIIFLFSGKISQNDTIKNGLLIYSSVFLFQGFMVIDYYYRYALEAWKTAAVKICIYIVGSLAKIYIVLKYPVLELVVASFALDIALLIFLAIVPSWRNARAKAPRALAMKAALQSMSRDMVALTLSSVAILLYMRVDQVMITFLLGSTQNGNYFAATRVYEAYLLLPYLVSMSALPTLSRLIKDDPQRLISIMKRLYCAAFWTGLFVALLSIFISPALMTIAFGDEYSGSHTPLTIMMLTAPIVGIGSFTARYLVVTNRSHIFLRRCLVALAINITGNLIFIPLYGINGAAFSTLLTIFYLNFFANFTDSNCADITDLIVQGIQPTTILKK